MRRDARWPYKCLVKSTPFQREFDQEHATRSTTKLRKMKRRIKTPHSKMVTMYSLCFVRQNCHSSDLSIDWRNVLRDVLHALMFSGRLVTSNGGWIYEHAIKRVVVGLIPLKLHPKRFWRKGNLVKIKRNNLKWYISSYVCPKNDLPGR